MELKGKGVVSDATRLPILWFEHSYGSLVSKIRVSKIPVSKIRAGRLLLDLAKVPPAVTGAQTVLVRDITTIAGVRDNPLVGYSLVVGLNGTGDRQQTLFTTQTLANIMQRMGVQIPASSSSSKILQRYSSPPLFLHLPGRACR